LVKIQNFKLVEKNKLTHEIYELIFEWEDEMEFNSGQFITFLLPLIWGRAYSILKMNGKKITLIVKKRGKENWGRWGSKLICELKIGENLKWVGPAWHFLLNENENNKLFIGTWTWFVPLYCQIISAIKKWLKWNLMLIFWMRNYEDLFYIEKLEKLKKNNPNFDYKIYLSRLWNEEKIKYKCNKWYVTDYLIEENIKKFRDFYICWIPIMIKSSKEILEKSWINKKNVFTEEY
jgi:NAD(P)H-flavin reductase